MKRLFLLSLNLAILLLFSGTGISTPVEPVKLTAEKEGFICPVFSPDGRSIAMTRQGWDGIWRMKSDGTELQELTTDPGSGYKFEWSPDGRRIAYRTDTYFGDRRHFAIRIVDVETKGIEEIVGLERFLGTPRWISEDGGIVYQSDRDGSTMQIQALKPDPPATPNPGSHIVAGTTEDLQIWTGQVDDNDRALITGPDERCFDPIVSPSGDRVCYGVLAHGGCIAVAKADGSERVDLGYGSNPRWSPDGRSLVYEVTEDDGHNITGSDLFVIDRAGHDKLRLTDTPDRIERWPSWSPDGKTIAFSSAGAIYILPFSSPISSEE